ncbi:hypothetical protein [Nocardia sp. NPDC047038]|uniref:hypothetical protein n=1 Tax=Nocardia sp. NPDC047038 TaxID=3154338 RepID=UPI0033D077F6
MDGQLDAAQKANLRGIYQAFQSMDPQEAERDQRRGQVLAAELRRSLPDLDSVTMGRVLLEVGNIYGLTGGRMQDPHLVDRGNELIMAALDLTAPAWLEDHPAGPLQTSGVVHDSGRPMGDAIAAAGLTSENIADGHFDETIREDSAQHMPSAENQAGQGPDQQ